MNQPIQKTASKNESQHILPELPYPKDALEPHISAETLAFHYDKHHATYVKKLNKLLPGTGLETASLEEIITSASGAVFDNAAQTWNHTFYWNCLSPEGGGEPKGALAKAIDQSFGDFTKFKKQFTESATSNFGSGWTWLVQNPEGTLTILNTSNAGNPLTVNKQPLLTCDVWEHAYYIDYRNARNKYLEAFWNLVNWEFAAQNLGT